MLASGNSFSTTVSLLKESSTPSNSTTSRQTSLNKRTGSRTRGPDRPSNSCSKKQPRPWETTAPRDHDEAFLQVGDPIASRLQNPSSFSLLKR